MILPPEGKAGIGDLPAALALRGKLKSDTPLDVAAGELAPKLARARTTLGKDADAYEGWSPLGAGIMMAGDYRKSVRLETAEPERTIGRLARKHEVKARPVATYKVMPLVKTAVREHSREAGLICLEGVLDEISAPAPRPPAPPPGPGRRGDVRGTRSPGRGTSSAAPLALPGMSDLRAQGDAGRGRGGVGGDEDRQGMRSRWTRSAALVARGKVLDLMRARGFECRRLPNKPSPQGEGGGLGEAWEGEGVRSAGAPAGRSSEIGEDVTPHPPTLRGGPRPPLSERVSNTPRERPGSLLRASPNSADQTRLYRPGSLILLSFSRGDDDRAAARRFTRGGLPRWRRRPGRRR